MKRKLIFSVFVLLLLSVSFVACQRNGKTSPHTTELSTSTTHQKTTEITVDENNQNEQDNAQLSAMEIDEIIKKYDGQMPTEWGEKIDGVVNNFVSEEKAIALTFDACGGPNGSGFDKELIDFLISENISATLFINKRWIENNKEIFLSLADNPLFEIENHGFEHRPLSVNTNEIYGINGTGSPRRVVEEIKNNEDLIFELTGRRTKFFRSGTAYYDEVSVSIAQELGYRIAGFQINGDGGATFTPEQIRTAISKVKGGHIVIYHFNQPAKSTYEGLREPLLELKASGYKFLKLEETIK